MASAYFFHPMSRDHLPMIRRWLETREVVRWWGEPDQQYELVSGDLDHPDMDQFIAVAGDAPFAYIQCYALSTSNESLWPRPQATRGIDQFIGEPAMIGKGHGSSFIRQFTDGLLSVGVPRIVTYPDPAHARAGRAYAKAGFERERVVNTPDGPALLMVRNP